MKKGASRNKGQIQLSFGMIFTIILIVFFIGFAFYAIQKFLELQTSAQTNQFYDNLQNDVNTVWNSAQTSQAKSYSLPSSVIQVCFLNNQNNNLFLYGSSGKPVGSNTINNLNITAMTSSGDLCFNAVKGKVSFILQKNFGETLVTIRS